MRYKVEYIPKGLFERKSFEIDSLEGLGIVLQSLKNKTDELKVFVSTWKLLSDSLIEKIGNPA